MTPCYDMSPEARARRKARREAEVQRASRANGLERIERKLADLESRLAVALAKPAAAVPVPEPTPAPVKPAAAPKEPEVTGAPRVRRALERELASWGQRGAPGPGGRSAEMDAINAAVTASSKARRNNS